jgi:hypothetical protein
MSKSVRAAQSSSQGAVRTLLPDKPMPRAYLREGQADGAAAAVVVAPADGWGVHRAGCAAPSRAGARQLQAASQA